MKPITVKIIVIGQNKLIYIHVCVSFVSCGHSGMGLDQCGTGARPPTFQLGGDAIGTAFLLARYLILSQFSIDCCQNAPDPAGGLAAPPPPTPSWKIGDTHTPIPR